MATPVEHYETAEHLLEVAVECGANLEARNALVAEAQVHATLSNAPWALDDRVLDEVAAGLDAETVGALLAVVRELSEWAGSASTVPDRPDAEAYVDAETFTKAAVARLIRPVLELAEAARA